MTKSQPRDGFADQTRAASLAPDGIVMRPAGSAVVDRRAAIALAIRSASRPTPWIIVDENA